MATVTLPNGDRVLAGSVFDPSSSNYKGNNNNTQTSIKPDTQLNNAGQYQFTNVSPEARDAYISANGSNPTQGAYMQQLSAQTNMYNQQAAAQAAKIRQAIANQTQQANATKEDYTNQMNAAIGTLNTERAKISGQTTTLNNTASNTGISNAQKIRNSLAQMGLLQSGESASQQLLNDTTVQNNINANNLQGQELDMDYGNKIASAQTELAAKVKQINDAIALAQSQGDENALLVLQDAQAKIADATATSAVNYNNYAYTAGRDAVNDRFTQQQFDAQKVQNALDNVYRQNQADLAARQWQDSFNAGNSQWEKSFNADTAYKNASLASSNSNSAADRAISQQNANTNAAKLNQENDSIKLNDLIQRLNSIYTIKDPYEGTVSINPELRDQLEAAILGQQLSDSDTKRLLAIYGFDY